MIRIDVSGAGIIRRFNRLQLTRAVVAALVSSVVLLGCALIYFVVAWQVFGLYLRDQSIPYFFYVSLFILRPILGLAMIPVVGTLLLFGVLVVFIHAEYSHQNRVIYGLSLFIWFLATILACGAGLPGFLSEEKITHYDDERLGAYLYRLDFLSAGNGPGLGTADFELWQCDSLGLICSEIHDEDLSTQIDPDSITKSPTAHLIVGANSISMQINDNVVYVYTPQ